MNQHQCEIDLMRSFDRFLKDSKGAVTTEFTVLVPAFVFLMVFFADASVIYLTHSEMYNAARDVARRMATGQLESPSDVQAYTAEHLFLGRRVYTVDPNFGGVTTVSIAVSVNQAVFFGVFFTPILGKYLVVTSTVTREPRLIGISS